MAANGVKELILIAQEPYLITVRNLNYIKKEILANC